jgi:diguanylate cyclase (GGDEF)-like protein
MSALRLFLLPLLILVAALSMTWLVWEHERNNTRKELQAQFDFALRDTVSRIEQRIGAYEQTLRGVQGLLVTTDLKNRKAIREYVETLQLDANFSGIQVIGVVERVQPAGRDVHIDSMRRAGFAKYNIHPGGERESYAAIVQREPGMIADKALLGLDVWANPERRVAMERARDSGMPAITTRVQLAIDREASDSPGFIMYLPVFAQGQARDSVAQRRANLVGWVYAAFRVSDFMASLYGKQVSGLSFSIYDGIDPKESALMYRSGASLTRTSSEGAAAISAIEYMVVAGHTWALTQATQEEFEVRFGRNSESVIIVSGFFLSLTMALLAWFMISGRARALSLAAEMTEELRHMAQHDPLTGLPNRALFSDRLQQQLAYAKRHDRRFAIIFLDLDNFKPINDNYGHAVGDRLLQQVAKRLQEALRASDTVGRIGGDEFVILTAELAGAELALALAEKVREAVRQPYMVEARKLSVSCSIGVAIYPDDGTDEITLSKLADEAMYRAKEDGRDSVRLAT